MLDAVSPIRYRSAIGRGVLVASVLGSAVAFIDGLVRAAMPAKLVRSRACAARLGGRGNRGDRPGRDDLRAD